MVAEFIHQKLSQPLRWLSFVRRQRAGDKLLRQSANKPPYLPPAEPKQVQDWLDNTPQAKALAETYGLSEPLSLMTLTRAQITMTYAAYLQAMVRAVSQTEIPVQPVWLDVGAKNWDYGQALTRVLAPKAITGVELDAYRRYADGYCRWDYAQTHAKAMAEFAPAHYIAGDVCALTEPFDGISWFFPFVVPAPLVAWGLPDQCFKPQALLQHVLGLLKPGGLLFIVNQGDWEAEAQAELLKNAQVELLKNAQAELLQNTQAELQKNAQNNATKRISYKSIVLPEPFYAYRHTHRAFLVQKEA
ncbi:MAG: hypothetical protein VKJ06_00810 [Vampirovibrionales bacterium]|nr:hypothetical protein [Vampirovibrionales bacterium]